VRGLLKIAYRLLVIDRGKFAALVVGITFTVFLMIMTTSLFAGILRKSAATVTNIGATMWVMDPAVNTVASSIPMPDYVLDQSLDPVIAMSASEDYMGVRCYIDEILVHRLPQGPQMKAQMFIRGTDIRIPLEYVRIQPYVSPKIELSNQRTERVDVRVLPVIFRFAPPKEVQVYPGQLVDVYIGQPQQ